MTYNDYNYLRLLQKEAQKALKNDELIDVDTIDFPRLLLILSDYLVKNAELTKE